MGTGLPFSFGSMSPPVTANQVFRSNTTVAPWNTISRQAKSGGLFTRMLAVYSASVSMGPDTEKPAA